METGQGAAGDRDKDERNELEEDEFYDELELLEEKSIQQEEEKDYEM